MADRKPVGLSVGVILVYIAVIAIGFSLSLDVEVVRHNAYLPHFERHKPGLWSSGDWMKFGPAYALNAIPLLICVTAATVLIAAVWARREVRLGLASPGLLGCVTSLTMLSWRCGGRLLDHAAYLVEQPGGSGVRLLLLKEFWDSLASSVKTVLISSGEIPPAIIASWILVWIIHPVRGKRDWVDYAGVACCFGWLICPAIVMWSEFVVYMEQVQRSDF